MKWQPAVFCIHKSNVVLMTCLNPREWPETLSTKRMYCSLYEGGYPNDTICVM